MSERLNSKLEKLAEDDPKRAELQAQYQPAVWLEDAARRVGQIQAVTHSLKPIHPDAKGSSLYREPSALPPLDEMGSHALGDAFDADVVGNAAALDVYKFLKLMHQGQSLLSLATQGDADLGAALSEDTAQAAGWMAAFAGLSEARGRLSSHTLAKQLYWPVGDDPHDDAGYHLLAPLYPTSLVQRVYQTLQDDRFGEEAKAAREARKAGHWHARPVREYPHLAIQKLGGTKPQNISQLNSERRGDNLLLASLPPVWRSAEVRPVLGTVSLFKVFRHRPEARRLTQLLRRFLEGDPASNLATRTQRDEWVEALLEELMLFTAEQQTLEPGWTAEPRCELPASHRAWLDPEGVATADPVPDLMDALAQDFANWLNHELRDPLPMGDPEYLHWRKQARELFTAMEREGVL
ncbi:type I-F CRISPR-associated protein Csy1 [Ideonella sp. B7]|uniref:type I-F CRISPR-associated protein Csy1 n=1 Tax=Ideonella benzenivorans TaxID=2831643 RepID=UPI001CEC1E15|nr:type I-F CRISPR-associated protein Csy1 [Ideonella benzenivorans]MCA6215895.1 type I-F CRISPR-associated protein Csy1 [Ideonella benzenivorans]